MDPHTEKIFKNQPCTPEKRFFEAAWGNLNPLKNANKGEYPLSNFRQHNTFSLIRLTILLFALASATYE